VIVKITMHGALQSLNVSVAAAIALYESAASRPRSTG
jgi:tRNA G18 (ribose-2'-O)-methylase SpoU